MADEFNQQNSGNFNQMPPQQFQQVPPQQYQPPVKEKKPIFKKWWFWVIIVVVALILIVSISGGDDSDSSGDSANTTVASVDADSNDDSNDDGVIGDYQCVVKSAKLTEDYDGSPAVLVTYEFTNNSTEAKSFDLALSDHVFQDGIELEKSYFSDEETEGFDTQIKPGITHDVNCVYVLRDTTTPLEVEITEWISFTDEKLVTTINIEQ